MSVAREVGTRSRRPWAAPDGPTSGHGDALLHRVETLLLAEGFRSLTVDDIAAKLQRPRSSLNAIAPTKDELVTVALQRFFREATKRIENRVLRIIDPGARVTAYLVLLSDELRRMSPNCYDDIISYGPTADIYRLTVRASATRVHELLNERAAAASHDASHVQFMGAAVGVLIEEIVDARLLQRTGLSPAEAFAELRNFLS